jgi:hypothetical protein
MIRIPCRVCKFELELPEELAGTEYQCPQCHLLNDVPTLHELKQIHEDGTYVMNENAAAGNPERLSEMIYVFAKDKTDEEGNEIDLRGPVAGEENSYKMADEPSAEQRPKYDPETGELIRPIEVVVDPSRQRIDPASIPMAQPALGYATTTATRPISTRSAFFSLLRPANALVWNLVFSPRQRPGVEPGFLSSPGGGVCPDRLRLSGLHHRRSVCFYLCDDVDCPLGVRDR